MLGAIIGDVVGSRFEFHNYRNKDFELFTSRCFFTDDTVMTAAVANALINHKDMAKELQKYGRKYEDRGYGGRFARWLYTDNPKPYNSYGNGAAMRISAVGWLANNESEVKALAKQATEVTHNHPEGLKGAEVTAMCIYLARHKASKKDIKEYVSKNYDINFNYEELVKHYQFNETCQDSVPQAIYCFLISNSFEDCLRTVISIGGDSDTLGAIACSVAEAYYGIPDDIKNKVLNYFDNEDKEWLLKPLNEVYKKCGYDNYIGF